ncbi:MAG: YhcH/YjgK/YiaL family protein [Acholeplasmatales bacterium]|jgi:YhcH/YjgK/YiaL family protein|nr:YhcH/YjgK/YiaL family protein [Acholeplasmatales bacterium]
MIVGKLEHIERYKGLDENLDKAIDYILNNDLMALPKGKTIVDGDNVYINRDTYVAKDLKDCFFERHRYYLDMQIVLKGRELFGYTDQANPTLKETTGYNTEKDVVKYNQDDPSKVEDALFVELGDGTAQFAIVYPEDAHLAKAKANEDMVEKAVIKIKIKK